MKKFSIIIDDDGSLGYENEGMQDYEIIGVMQMIEADLRVQFASFSYKQRKEAKAGVSELTALVVDGATPDAKDETPSGSAREEEG